MNRTETAVMTSALTDVRTAPLDRVAAPETLSRLRPDGTERVAVAAFNASL